MIGEALKAEIIASTALQAFVQGDSPGYDRVFPLVIPQQVPRGTKTIPCIVYAITAVERSQTYCGTIGLVRTRFSTDCYSKSYEEARNMAKALRELLTDFRGALGGTVATRTIVLETDFDLTDSEPGLFRVMQTWAVWHEE